MHIIRHEFCVISVAAIFQSRFFLVFEQVLRRCCAMIIGENSQAQLAPLTYLTKFSYIVA